MRATFSSVVILLPGLMLAGPDAPPESGWEIDSESRTVVASLPADQPIEAWMDIVTPQLVIECHKGSVRAALEFGVPALPDRELERRRVTLRFDNGRLVDGTFDRSDDGLGLVFPYPVAFIDKLLQHERLMVRVNHLNIVPQPLSFDLRGLDAAIVPVRQACADLFANPEEILDSGLGSVTPPLRIPESHVEPAYPARARGEKLRAQVYLRAVVRLDGSLEQIEVVHCTHPGYGFEEAAVEAFSQWRYTPGTLWKRPVSVRFPTFVYFAPPDDD
jgi:TonB family protein